MWPLIVLIAMLLMGPLLLVVALLNMTDSLLAATSAIVLSFIAAWAVCVFVSRSRRGGIGRNQS
jgi:VIT1/CCC1 family predicted Fe2+/Mn2+ transporter